MWSSVRTMELDRVEFLNLSKTLAAEVKYR